MFALAPAEKPPKAHVNGSWKSTVKVWLSNGNHVAESIYSQKPRLTGEVFIYPSRIRFPAAVLTSSRRKTIGPTTERVHFRTPPRFRYDHTSNGHRDIVSGGARL